MSFQVPPAASLLAEVPARRLLASMINPALRRRAKPKPEAVKVLDSFAPEAKLESAAPQGISDLIRAADEGMDQAGDLGLTVSFKDVLIRDAEAEGLDWGRGEVYVITSILDGSGKQPEFKTQHFEGIRNGDRLPLGGGGMLVGMLKNPRWFVDVHMLVMESDDDIRSIGKAIETARKDSGLKDLVTTVGGLAAFDPTMVTKVTSAVDIFMGILSGILSSNGDDHIATVHDFYLKTQGFGSGRHPQSGRMNFQNVDVAYQIDLTQL